MRASQLYAAYALMSTLCTSLSVRIDIRRTTKNAIVGQKIVYDVDKRWKLESISKYVVQSGWDFRKMVEW